MQYTWQYTWQQYTWQLALGASPSCSCLYILGLMLYLLHKNNRRNLFNHHSCFAKLSQSFLISESLQHDESYLKKHFPHFLWLMRDFDFECRDDNGEEMSATDYVLQKILVTNNKGDKPPNARDRAVCSVRANFSHIKCLAIPSPGPGISNPKKKKMIDPDFHTSINSAKQHVVSNTPVKLGFNGSTVMNGPMLAALLDEYVQALNKPGTVPNLEVSYQKVVEVTLTEISQNLAEKYRKQMSELLDHALPLEEGDVEALKHTHSVRLEESLSGAMLRTHKDTIESVKKTDTLFEVHVRVYTNLLREFTIELHKLIPEAAHTDEIVQKDEKTRKSQLLEKFEKLIFRVDTASNVLEGYISHLTQSNTEKSESSCKEVFETIYKQQIQTGAPEREKLKTKYYKKAVGPAKDYVFQEMISQIPGPPQNLTMKLETQILSWEKPLVNADAVDYYCVEWYKEGDEHKKEKVHKKQFKLEKLKPKTDYFIKVKGYNDQKDRFGENCTVFNFLTSAGKPEKPKMPNVSPQTEETVKLTITMLSVGEQNGSPVTNIKISRRSDKNSIWKSEDFPVDSSQGDIQTLVIHVNCENNEEILHFRVQFENEAGVSEPSDSAQLEITDMIPGKPVSIKTISKARQIQVIWDPPKINQGAVKSYQIQYWQKEEGTQSKSEVTVSQNERSLPLTSLSPYTKYTIRVYSRNEKKAASGYGAVDVQTLADVPDKPHPPTIRVTSASKATITFERQKPNEENGSTVKKICIERQTKRNQQATKWTVVKEHSLENSSLSDIANVNLPVELLNLTEPFISCYRVVTFNSIGSSYPSQAAAVHPESIIPGMPQKLDSTATSNSITISWKKTNVNPLASKRYRIQYKEVKGETWNFKRADADTHSCTASELRPNTEYTFIVQALNGTLLSDESTLLVSTLLPVVPPKPRPPIVIPRRTKFILRAHLPPVEESGGEATQLHVNYYSNDTAIALTEDYAIKQNNDESMEVTNTHEQQIQANIDETCWISISLSNEVGKSQESDLVGLSYGDMTPGIPDKLECTPEARNVKLSWKKPKINENSANYYEVLIKGTDDKEWTSLENVPVQQKICNKTLSYEATVNDLSPITSYQFGVRAVNNTTRYVRIGDCITLETKTKRAPLEKHIKSVAVESTVGELVIDAATKLIQTNATTPKIYPSAPSSLFVDKISSNSVKVRWRRPEKNPEEVYFYTVKLRAGNYIKAFEKRGKILKVKQMRRTMGNSTVFENLDPFTTYTISVGSYNDNKKRHEDAIIYDIFTTRTSTDARLAAHILSAPTLFDPVAVAYAQEAEENIDQSDDEFKADPDIYPSAPTNIIWELYGRNELKLDWKLPNQNSQEMHHFEVQVSEQGSGRVLHNIESYGTSEKFTLADLTKRYEVSVTSINFYGKKRHDATNTVVIP